LFKIFDHFATSIFNPTKVDTKFRFSLYVLINTLSYYENTIDFFDTLMNIEDFFENFKLIVVNL